MTKYVKRCDPLCSVLKLNELNEKCDHGLLETDQREDVCALTLLTAKQA